MHAPRPRIQRAFLSWLDERKHDFKDRPVVTGRTDGHINLAFQGVTAQINAAITRWEINVATWERGECWDLLLCLEAVPQRITNGYQCCLCDPGARAVYASREALWRDHLFEPFREWCNGALAPARWLALYQTSGGGATWAKLIADSDVQDKSDALSLIPLRR